jgi:hypothetical protein
MICWGSENTTDYFFRAQASTWPKRLQKHLIDAAVAMKQRNRNWCCPCIAQQIALAFGIELDEDVVRRILSAHTGQDRIREVLPGLLFSVT